MSHIFVCLIVMHASLCVCTGFIGVLPVSVVRRERLFSSQDLWDGGIVSLFAYLTPHLDVCELCVRPSLLCHFCKPIGCPAESTLYTYDCWRCMYPWCQCAQHKAHIRYIEREHKWNCVVLCTCCWYRWSWCRWTRERPLPSGQRTAHCNASKVSPLIPSFII